MKNTHPPLPLNAPDDPSRLDARDSSISMSHVFLIVLALHVFIIVGALCYHWWTISPEGSPLSHRIVATLGRLVHATQPDSARTMSRSEILVLALVARFNGIDARLNKIEEELRKTGQRDARPEFPRPPTSEGFKRKSGKPSTDAVTIRITYQRPAPDVAFHGPHT